MEYDALRFWQMPAQWIFNILFLVVLGMIRKNQATSKRLKQTERQLTMRIDTNERDIIKVRADLNHLPNQSQFSALGTDIRTLTSELGKVEGRLEGINRVADIMNQFLINQGGNKHE